MVNFCFSFLFSGENADLTFEERVGKWQFMALDRDKNWVCDTLALAIIYSK